MSQIEISVYGGRYIECQYKQCHWARECTNHYTAGDFRTDFGLRPVLTGYNGESKIAWCSTKESQLSREEQQFGEYVHIAEVPQQHSLW